MEMIVVVLIAMVFAAIAFVLYACAIISSEISRQEELDPEFYINMGDKKDDD